MMEFPFEQNTPNYLNPINNLMTDDLFSVERIDIFTSKQIKINPEFF